MLGKCCRVMAKAVGSATRSDRGRRAPRWLVGGAWLALVACVTAGAAGAPRVAFAEASDADLRRAEAKAIEAKAYFKQGLFVEAAEKFMEAFAISRKADTMFNAARAYEEAGAKKQALALFLQYLDLPDASEEGKAAARAKIAELQAAASTEPTEPATATPATPAPPVVPPAESRAPAPSPAPAVSARKATGREVDGLGIVLWTSGAIVGLLGVAAWSSAVQQANDANAMDFGQPNAKSRYNTAFDEAKAGQSFGVVLTLVGAGAIGWGTWRYLRGTTTSRPAAPTVWVAPLPGGSAGGMAWSF